MQRRTVTRAVASGRRPSRFSWDALPLDVRGMIIQNAPDITAYVAVSKDVRALALGCITALKLASAEECASERLEASDLKRLQRPPLAASKMGDWPALRRLCIDFFAMEQPPCPRPFKIGDGFRRVRKLEVAATIRQLRPLLKGLPALDWLSLDSLAPADAMAQCALISKQSSLRHLRIVSLDDFDFGPTLLALQVLPKLQMLVLKLGPETSLPSHLLGSWPELRLFHTDCTLDDAGLKGLVDNPRLTSLSLYGLDHASLHGLLPSPGVRSSLTALSMINCMGMLPDALVALAGVHPLTRVALTFFDFSEVEVDYSMADLIGFAAGCPLLEELQLGEFIVHDDDPVRGRGPALSHTHPH